MIRHWIKLMWNKKRQNGLMMLEVGFSFLILFCAFSFALYYNNIFSMSQGFDHENVWIVEFTGGEFDENFRKTKDAVYQDLSAFPEVVAASFSTPNFPFSGNSWRTNLGDEFEEVSTEYMRVDPSYAATMNVELTEGRWFEESDFAETYRPMIINEALRKATFGEGPAVGKTIQLQDQTYKVLGVAGNFKFSDPYQEPRPCFLMPVTPDFTHSESLLIQVSPSTSAETEQQIAQALQRTAAGFDVNIRYMSNAYDQVAKETFIPLVVMFIICGFLVFNVALGLFGVLWYNINQRKSEIGVRRAMGATGNGISFQFVGEMLILAIFGILIGSFFAIQFPLLKVFDLENTVYFLAMLFSALTVCVLVFICAWQPSREAAMVHPAIVLHEE